MSNEQGNIDYFKDVVPQPKNEELTIPKFESPLDNTGLVGEQVPGINITPTVDYFQDITTNNEVRKAIESSPGGILTQNKSKEILPKVEEELRAQETSLLYGLTPSMQQHLDNTKLFKDIGSKYKFHEYSIDTREAYTALNDGTLIPKYPTFLSGVNNQELHAQNQTTFDKWINGAGKFIGKTIVNVVGGTVGILDGATEAITKGRFSALYDNDFGRQLDDWNTQLDYALPNYKTQHEDQMGFLRSMGTANFWADDFLGALSFMAGAIISEGIWAYATGGTSLATTTARLGARLGAGAISTARVSGISAAASATNATMRNMLRGARIGQKVGGAFNTLRFATTSSFFESGFEARHAINEATDDYIRYMETVEGRLPTQEELSSFLKEAVDYSNGVFAANVAIVGTSNYLMLGQYFGMKPTFNKAISKAIDKKLFGFGVEKAADGTLKAMNGTRMQRGLRTALKIAEKPFTEGVYEEGLQGVTSETYKKWLSYKYDKNLMKDNLGLVDALAEGFSKAYTTKEGLKEVGIGALVGFLGNAGARGKSGRYTISGITEHAQEQEFNERMANQWNEAITSSIPASIARMATRIGHLSQAQALVGKQQEAEKAGNNLEAATYSDLLEFTNILMQDESMDFVDLQNEFSKAIDEVNLGEISDEFRNMNEAEIAELKSSMKEAYTRDINDYSKAIDAAKSLSPRGFQDIASDGTYSDYTATLAMNIYAANKAANRVEDYAQTVSDMLGEESYANALTAINNVGKEKTNAARRFNEATREIARLEKIQQDLQQELAIEVATSNTEAVGALVDSNGISSDAAKSRKKAIDKINERIAKNTVKLAEAQSVLDSIDATFNNITTSEEIVRNKFINSQAQSISLNELAEALSKVDAIEDTINAIRKNPNISDNTIRGIESTIREYSSSVVAMNSFLNTAMNLSDPKFQYSKDNGGLLGKFINRVRKVEKDDNIKFSDTLVEAVDNMNLNDSQKFSLLTMLQARADNVNVFGLLNEGSAAESTLTDSITDTTTVETITEDTWIASKEGIVSDDVMTTIVNKDAAGVALTPREKAIKRTNRNQYRRVQRKVRNESGYSVNKTKNVDKNDSVIDKLRNQINSILDTDNSINEVDISTTDFIPTKDEVKEFIKLDKKRRKGVYDRDKLSDIQQKELERYSILKDKINRFGKIEGTEFLDGVTLTEAIINLQQLQEGKQPIPTHEETLEDVTTLIESLPFDGAHSDIDTNMYTLVYDKVTANTKTDLHVSNGRVLDSAIVIQGLNTQGFISHINSFSHLEISDQISGEVNILSDLNSFESTPGDNVSVVLEDGSKFSIDYDIRSNIIIDNLQTSIIESNSDLLFKFLGDAGSKFKILLDNKFKPVNSNLQDGGTQFNIEAIYKLEAGQTTKGKLSALNPYNSALIEKYNSGKKTKEAKKQLADKIVIELVDSNGELISIVKAIHSDNLTSDGLVKLTSLRNSIVEKILENHTDKNGNINTNMELSVDNLAEVVAILPGRPNFTIENDNLVYNRVDEYNKDKIHDIGFIQDGKLHLRNGDLTVETYPFTTHIVRNKNKIYSGQKVPVVVLKIADKYYTYPVRYDSSNVNITSILESIANNTTLSLEDRLYMLNEEIISAGLSTEEYGFTYGDMTEQAFNLKLDNISNATITEDIGKATDASVTKLDEVLSKVSININLNNQPFHSPKLIIDYKQLDSNNSLDTNIVSEVFNMGDTLVEETEETLNKKC